ncbi:hypothetical protein H0266_14585 [Halobacillus locisalis]|uniref:Uncharacterized protein n=1 Tax=Halobacillus locisalis TaxID=220753 RepID=A0A838CW27_9BACI|nr:hypothetical protein [Halobacillus locisalis]MBA2176121.1 hypothetical protein [Halobacillus locisalis]
MKWVTAMYAVMVLIVVVTLVNVFILGSEFDGLASWLIVVLFLAGSISFANAKYYLSRK